MNVITAEKKLTCPSEFQSPLGFFDFPHDSTAKMKINGDKTSPYLRPFWIGSVSDKNVNNLAFATGFIQTSLSMQVTTLTRITNSSPTPQHVSCRTITIMRLYSQHIPLRKKAYVYICIQLQKITALSDLHHIIIPTHWFKHDHEIGVYRSISKSSDDIWNDIC
jgi:hypothetical protein